MFFRQIGIDPDEHKPPGEAVMLERLRAGRFRSHDLLEDALTVAVVETGVAVRAFDADRFDGELGLRIAQQGEHLAGDRLDLPDGAIVVADERRPIGLIFGETGTAASVAPATTANRAVRRAGPGHPGHQHRGGALDRRRDSDLGATAG